MQAGHEQTGQRLALVLSPAACNDKTSWKQYYDVSAAIIERERELVNWVKEAIETRS